MAPHLTPAEQGRLLRWQQQDNLSPVAIHARLARERGRKGIAAPELTGVRKFLKGKTHKRGAVETRGRKRIHSRRHVLAMNRKRIELIKKVAGAKQVTWDDVARRARAPSADSTTVARAFQREGVDVRLRPARGKPQRLPEHEQERADLCDKMRRLPTNYFSENVHLIIDNKRFDTPTTPAARLHLQKQKVKGQLRTRSEGLKPGFTRPNQKRHKVNAGGTVDIMAGISGGRKGMEAKKAVNIKAMAWPRYSPDLMPLDFSLWANIQKRVDASSPGGREPVAAFKKRLRRIALSTPRAQVRDMVAKIRDKAREIYEAGGKDIRSD